MDSFAERTVNQTELPAGFGLRPRTLPPELCRTLPRTLAGRGYEFSATMTGPTLGGDEVVVVMSKPAKASPARRYEYELLATNKTSTMQKELREAGAEGFRYRGQSVAKTSFGGREVVVILEREIDHPAKTYAYKLTATTRTKTMEKELNQAGEEGFRLMGLTVSETAFGGKELVSILMHGGQE